MFSAPSTDSNISIPQGRKSTSGILKESFNKLIKIQSETANSKMNTKLNMSSIKKSIIDGLLEEMGNIDHCMKYFTKLAKSKKFVKDTAILANKQRDWDS